MKFTKLIKRIGLLSLVSFSLFSLSLSYTHNLTLTCPKTHLICFSINLPIKQQHYCHTFCYFLSYKLKVIGSLGWALLFLGIFIVYACQNNRILSPKRRNMERKSISWFVGVRKFVLFRVWKGNQYRFGIKTTGLNSSHYLMQIKLFE